MVSAVPGSLVVCVSESLAMAFFSVEFSAATAYFGAFSAGDAARTTFTPAIKTRAVIEPPRQPHIFAFVLAKRRLRCIEPSQIVWTWKGEAFRSYGENGRGARTCEEYVACGAGAPSTGSGQALSAVERDPRPRDGKNSHVGAPLSKASQRNPN